MRNKNIIYMTDRADALLDKFPHLKEVFPLNPNGITKKGMNDFKRLSDAEFAAVVSLSCTFGVTQEVLQYIGDRMLDLGIEHQKSVKEKSISTKSQILSTTKFN